jgi:hypothetical protein
MRRLVKGFRHQSVAETLTQDKLIPVKPEIGWNYELIEGAWMNNKLYTADFFLKLLITGGKTCAEDQYMGMEQFAYGMEFLVNYQFFETNQYLVSTYFRRQ